MSSTSSTPAIPETTETRKIESDPDRATADQQQGFQFPSRPMTAWRPGDAIPRPPIVLFEGYENYRETPPPELEIDDVEEIWWLVAACFSDEELRSALALTVAQRQDWSCFIFSPIADLNGEGRYPTAIFNLLRDMLPDGAVLAFDSDEGSGTERALEKVGWFIIQNEIWHELTYTAFALLPLSVLPAHLRDLRFAGDLGL